MKKVWVTLGVIIISGILFVLADYLALFGVTKKEKLDFVETRVRTVTDETGDLILGVQVRCFQKKNRNACTRRDSKRAGVVSVHIPIRRVIESSLIFKKSETIIKSADPKLHMMFIHGDHQSTTLSLLVDDIINHPGKEHLVKMPRVYWDESGENNE